MKDSQPAFETFYAEPSRNGVYKPAQFRGSGVPMVNMGELFGHEFIGTQDMERIELSTAELERSALQDGDLLFGRRSVVEAGAGKCSLVVDPPEILTFESSIIRVRLDREKGNPRFFHYYFASPEGRGRVGTIVSGAAVKGIRGTDLAKLPVGVPPLPVQDSIADFLTHYDDLIENNRRRMVLLDEAARQLYREWFVRLRFPGHEHTPVVDGVPKGWRIATFGEILVEVESGGRPRGGATSDGVPSIGAENVRGIGQHDYSNEKFVPEEYFERMTRGVVKNRDVALYKDGANIGRASYFGEGFPHEKCAVNEHVFLLRTQPTVGQSYLYFWMTCDENRQAIANLNANTAQPGISQDTLKSLRILLPAEGLTRAFNEAVDAQVMLIFALGLINKKLRAGRDLLLPRLMDGEIAI